MAIVEFYKKDIEKLIGKKLTSDDIENKIPMLGCPLEKIEGQKLFYEIFPDRPDMLSAEGFSRTIKNFLSYSEFENFLIKESKIKLHINENVKKVRPFIVTAVIRNVKLSTEIIESLIQVQEKIHETIGRKRKKVAIGIHDLDKVKPPFFYKSVKPEEIEFIPLDMTEKMNLKQIKEKHPKGHYCKIIENHKTWPIIVDKNNDVLSFPPVINGELTRVTKKTKNLFIDVTGLDKKSINQCLNILVTSLYKRGFEIEKVDNGNIKTPDLTPKKFEINLSYINKLLDANFNEKDITKLLKKMGLTFNSNEVLIPCYRTDIMHPIDIVEDVAISYGYKNFKPRIPKVPTISKSLKINDFLFFVKNICIGLGFQEIVSMILTNKENEFEKMNTEKEEICETLNSVTTECTICRKSLLPSIIKTFSQNQHVEFPQKIFELGEVLLVDKKEETGSKTLKKICCAIADSKIGYEQISSILDSLMKNIGVNYFLKETKHKSFIDNRVANIFIDNKKIGIVGEIHPQVLQNWNLNNPLVAFELDLEKIFNNVL